MELKTKALETILLIDTITKPLDYYSTVLFTVVKGFVVQNPGVNVIELFFFVMDEPEKNICP
jgi:hypothetical protein